MSGMIAPDRKRIITSVVGMTVPAADLRGWVQARRRWHRGEQQIAAAGIPIPRPVAHRVALLKKLVHPRTMLGAWLFVAVRLLSRLPERRGPAAYNWHPNRKHMSKATSEAQPLPNRSPTPERF